MNDVQPGRPPAEHARPAIREHPAHGPHASPDRGKQPDGGHHAHMVADFRWRFWVSLVLTVPVLLLTPLIQELLGVREAWAFPGSDVLQFVLDHKHEPRRLVIHAGLPRSRES